MTNQVSKQVHEHRLGILQLTDTLKLGGAERVAVNLANLIPRDRFRSYLCATRHEGPLAENVGTDVCRLFLQRSHTLDWKAVRRLANYIRRHNIRVLHAHGSSLFLAAVMTLLTRPPFVIWHVHYGPLAGHSPIWLRYGYRRLARRAHRVITVSRQLADWCKAWIGLPDDRVEYIPNFVCEPTDTRPADNLPGNSGYRIVCVANPRPEKDQLTLLHAMASVVKQMPQTHLLLLGSCDERSDYLRLLRQVINGLGLHNNVSLLGQRKDVPEVLRGCDIGVLSSVSEGLPLALLEYGQAGLPVVATRVGQCAEVLQNGRCGLLVQPGKPDQFAEALLSLLHCDQRRKEFSISIRRNVRETYSAAEIINRVCAMYEKIALDISPPDLQLTA